MPQITGTSERHRLKSIAFLAFRILLSLAFIAAAGFKLSGHPSAIDEFNRVGLGQGFRYFTAVLEIAGALLLLWSRTIVFGAILLGAVCLGAFVAMATVLHGDVIHALVLGSTFAAIAWTHRSQLTRQL